MLFLKSSSIVKLHYFRSKKKKVCQGKQKNTHSKYISSKMWAWFKNKTKQKKDTKCVGNGARSEGKLGESQLRIQIWCMKLSKK